MRTARNNKIEVHDHDSSLLIVWVAYQAVLIPSATPTQQQQTKIFEKELSVSSDLTDLTDVHRQNSNNLLSRESSSDMTDLTYFSRQNSNNPLDFFSWQTQVETKNGQLEIWPFTRIREQ